VEIWPARSANDCRCESRRTPLALETLGELVVSLLKGLEAGKEEKEAPDREGW
jgi:hypothetical protein